MTFYRRMLLSDGYAARVLNTNPIVYWKQSEGGGSVMVDSSGNGFDGSYTGVTWDGTSPPMGGTAPYYDGVNDYGNLYSAGFASAFDLDEGCLSVWLKVADASVWTGTPYLIDITRNGNNFVSMFVPGTDNNIVFRRNGDATIKSIQASGFTETDWINIMMSWSVAGDELKAYKNGLQIGTTTTGNVAASGSGLTINDVQLGAANQTPALVWDGYFAHLAIWDRPIDADILALGTV